MYETLSGPFFGPLWHKYSQAGCLRWSQLVLLRPGGINLWICLVLLEGTAIAITSLPPHPVAVEMYVCLTHHMSESENTFSPYCQKKQK